MALAAAKAEGLLGDRPRDCTSFPSGPRSGIRAGSGPAFSGLEPAATGQRAGGRLVPSPSLGGGGVPSRTPWRVEPQVPSPTPLPGLPVALLSVSLRQPDDETAEETEVQTGCLRREAARTRVANWISGLKWGPQPSPQAGLPAEDLNDFPCLTHGPASFHAHTLQEA